MERHGGFGPHSEEFHFEGSPAYVKQRLAIDSMAERMDHALGPFGVIPNVALLAIVCVLALKERIFTNGKGKRTTVYRGKRPSNPTA